MVPSQVPLWLRVALVLLDAVTGNEVTVTA
jgi:hypothetical protein